MKIETAMLQGGPSKPCYILCGNDSRKRRLTLKPQPHEGELTS